MNISYWHFLSSDDILNLPCFIQSHGFRKSTASIFLLPWDVVLDITIKIMAALSFASPAIGQPKGDLS